MSTELRLLSLDALVELLRPVKRRTIWEHATGRRNPPLPSFRVGRTLMFRESDVQEWIDRQVRGDAA